jgi:hypothetical protein
LTNNRVTFIKVLISRKESIIYDIPYKFKIEDSPSLDSSKPIIESKLLANLAQWSSFTQYYPFANNASSKFSVPLTPVLSIIYMETTHGWYDALADKIGMTKKSILPMNVNVVYWNQLFSRSEIEDVHKNILAGTFLLRRIIDHCENANVQRVASLYNSINYISTQDYGARAEEIQRVFTEHYVHK